MNTSDAIDTIAAALADFGAEVTNPPTDGRGNFGKYATLAGIIDHVRPALSAHGLVVTQETVTSEGGVGVVTRVTHRSGQYLEFGPLWLLPTKTDPQAAGSAITYARRYALAAALGIAADEDDDGTAASQKQQKSTARTPRRDEGQRAGRSPEGTPSTAVDQGVSRTPEPADPSSAVSTDPGEGEGRAEGEAADGPARPDQWAEAIRLRMKEAQVLRAVRDFAPEVSSAAEITAKQIERVLAARREDA